MFDWINELPGYIRYLIILVLAGIIYQTAFARRLPLLKTIAVYIALAVGCWLLLIFQIMRFPIIEAMLITIVLIIVTRLRLMVGKPKQSKQD
ncbi:YlaH-like family protein [Thermoflavimicrobium dichotomicum]|uniref:YlaH-like protein n=1 Tax=Thermoflavimicrobium dichotomicum TaxID=46223 RepID=A0A1I3N8M4_9BACL|nr:YlaH-like family protein [Thermoflavimicrobium dichotomicum]SFJ05584.1 YlaH-like protein [Thermoflavimicrobium dichotomicum]